MPCSQNVTSRSVSFKADYIRLTISSVNKQPSYLIEGHEAVAL